MLGEVDLVDSGGDDDYFEPDFVCDDGETIPRYWFNDGYPDCSDGSDELASNDDHHDGEGPYYEWLYEQPTEFPNVTEGSSLHNVLSEGELIYCTDPFYPPFESYDSSETLVGFDVDVADYLASTLSDHYETPVEFTHVESEWDPIIPNLNEGSMCDAIISAMTKTPARESGVDFTRGYYTWSQGVVGGPGSDDISDVYELDANGVTIGVVSGLHSEFWASENLGMATVSAYEDIDSLLAALDSGDVMYALGETTLLSTDHAIMATFDEEHFGIALREGNNELLTALDVAINHLVESEYYASIHSEWLQGEPYVINDWSPDWDFGSHEQEYYGDEPGDESGDSSEDGFTCLYETWQVIPSSGVNDGYPDCYDGSDEETAPEVWACAVDVRVDSLPDTSFESFADKANEHPGFPEWCGEEVGELQIGDSQPNLPPPEDYYGAAIDEFDGSQGWQYVQARNATHWIQIGTGEMQDCSDEDLSWHEEYSGCAEPAAPDIAIDGELIQGQWGFTRYHWSGDYLYLAVPVNEALTPAWVAMGPRVTDFICDFDHNNRVPGWQVGDGVEDCYNGADENPDASSDEPGDPAGSTDLESMFEALDASNLQKTMEAFSERLDILLQDNVPDEPKYDIEDLCATMLWDPSDVRVLGVALVLEGGLLLGPQIENSMPHPTTTINVQFLSGQAARDAKSGASSQSSFDEMAPPSKHDLAKLYEILGPDYLPDLDTTDSDGDGTMDFFDSDDDNDGIPDWEDSEPKSLESEAGSSSLPAHGLVATLSVIAAAAMLIPRRED